MARKENVESLDILLRDLCDENAIFGGKLVVVGGDFHQVLPVLPCKTQREVVAASLVSSVLWPRFIRFNLTENVQAREDPYFSAFFLYLGNGELQTGENDLVQLPMQIVHPSEDTSDPIAELTAIAFPERDVRRSAPGNFTTTAILTPLNKDVDDINATMIDKFPGESVMYKSFDTVLDDNSAIYPPGFIYTLCPGGMSPHKLVLKKNSVRSSASQYPTFVWPVQWDTYDMQELLPESD
ncbi:uncharacterized protein [Spinacia oleracea]|uniref:ATP-dependent DNA helicase n=1 Tax=Spinacia oleracea TaxID=3562 RepID=A0A9R0J667_SPIOL|nr:uncharacterized protein LOC110800960 [Spinacia oleracea]